MFMLGDVAPETKKLVQVARECIDIGLEQVKPWNFLGDMAQAINDHARDVRFAHVHHRLYRKYHTGNHQHLRSSSGHITDKRLLMELQPYPMANTLCGLPRNVWRKG